MSSRKQDDYTVGYGKPPAHTRFQKGHSGNPRGRPKGKLNLVTVLNKALNEKVVVIEHGRRRRVTKLEAAFKQLVNKAVQGDPRAISQVLSLGSLIGVDAAVSAAVLDHDEASVLSSVLGRLWPNAAPAADAEEVP